MGKKTTKAKKETKAAPSAKKRGGGHDQASAAKASAAKARAEAVEALGAALEPPATEVVTGEPDPAELATALLHELGFERTGTEVEEIRPRVLLCAAETWRDATSDADRLEAESVAARAGWFRPPAADPKVVRQYEVLGTVEGLALRPMAVGEEASAVQAAAQPQAGPAAPATPAADLEELRLAADRARAQVGAAEEEAKRIVAAAKAASHAAAVAYREACKASGKAPALAGRSRSANISEKVTFEVEVVGDVVRIAVRGKPGAEERVPFEQVRASANKTATAFTEKWLGPKASIGNKAGTLSNRLRAILAATGPR